eukprot:ANDGO_02405.mRNA.1 hypothetical protein
MLLCVIAFVDRTWSEVSIASIPDSESAVLQSIEIRFGLFYYWVKYNHRDGLRDEDIFHISDIGSRDAVTRVGKVQSSANFATVCLSIGLASSIVAALLLLAVENNRTKFFVGWVLSTVCAAGFLMAACVFQPALKPSVDDYRNSGWRESLVSSTVGGGWALCFSSAILHVGCLAFMFVQRKNFRERSSYVSM